MATKEFKIYFAGKDEETTPDTSTFFLVGYDGTDVKKILIDNLGVSPEPGVKYYDAVVTQTGTSDPVAAVLRNTLGGTVVWTRVIAGKYQATLAGAFPPDTFIVQATYDDGGNQVRIVGGFQPAADPDFIQFFSYDDAGALTGLAGGKLFVSIKVYP